MKAHNIFEALCHLAEAGNEGDGDKLREAAKELGETIGEEGAAALKEGDVIGGIAHVVANHRRRTKKRN